MIRLLAENLERHSKERKRIRRKLCKYLRDNRQHLIDPWIKRKVDYYYMSDVSDAKLLYYVNIVRRIQSSEI